MDHNGLFRCAITSVEVRDASMVVKRIGVIMKTFRSDHKNSERPGSLLIDLLR